MTGLYFAMKEILVPAIINSGIRPKGNFSVCIELKCGEGIRLKFINKCLYLTKYFVNKFTKHECEGYIRTDFGTFMRLAYGIGWWELIKLILKKKIKIRGIKTLLKFKQLIKKLNGK